MIYVCSDTHYYHKAIITMQKRPFQNVHEMNQYMINSWNSVVTPVDEVYHLGDIAYKANPKVVRDHILSKLNGKIHLITGNHDKPKDIRIYSERLESIQTEKELKYDLNNKIYTFIMYHYPIYSWKGMYQGYIHLYGHTHTNKDSLRSEFKCKNVCVECLNYVPISIEEIIKEFYPEDFI